MVDVAGDYGDGLINRGVATWLDASRVKGKPCRRRIFEATLDARLIALDGATGDPCVDFGNRGQISLRDVARYSPGQYHMTSPPVVIDDMVVVGSAIDDNSRVDMPSGVVRAFDARTGKLRWKWEPLPPNDPGSAAPSSGKIWRTGAGNAWSVMAVDPERDLIFVPTGSASPDYYGGMRAGDDKWADSVVALRAKTGELVWGFQLVHHDLWDYDSASPTMLATVPHNGKNVPVVIQGNKTGFLYVLNRETGVPLFPVEERPVPQSDVPGELTSPTQPFPLAPPSLVPQKLSADDAWGITQEDRDYCRERIKSLRNDGLFTPPSVQGSLSEPGNVGGMNWSGSAYDPQHNLLLVNTNNLPAMMGVVARDRYWRQWTRIETLITPSSTGRHTECIARSCLRKRIACRARLRRGARWRPWIWRKEQFAGKCRSVRSRPESRSFRQERRAWAGRSSRRAGWYSLPERSWTQRFARSTSKAEKKSGSLPSHSRSCHADDLPGSSRGKTIFGDCRWRARQGDGRSRQRRGSLRLPA